MNDVNSHELEQKLWRLARHKAAAYASRSEMAAVAITSSVARRMVWEGSDIDLWGFVRTGEEDFEDGLEEGVYWEIDIKPLSWLEVKIDEQTWLRPPALREDEVMLGGIGELAADDMTSIGPDWLMLPMQDRIR